MVSIEVNGVADAYNRLTRLLNQLGKVQDSRNGKVRALDAPVLLRVNHPRRRVLFDPARNANPFFHLMEALWMIAGRNDVDFVRQFNSHMYTFSDDGKVFNAAYGHRWRQHFGYDQVLRAIDMLRANPNDRRVVLSMWDPYSDLGSESLDIPCNQQIMPRIQNGVLEFTTTNRSNDLIWGLCGANFVHLTVLQEFMASALGVGVGRWFHLSNNLHVYEHHFNLISEVAADPHLSWNSYPQYKMVEDWELFQKECQLLCDGQEDDFQEPFFDETVAPMLQAWKEYKAGNYDGAVYSARCIEAWDWGEAALAWLTRAIGSKK